MIAGARLAPLMAALAGNPQPNVWRVNDVPEWNPPAQYDKPYQGILNLQLAPQDQVGLLCARLFRQNGARGPEYRTSRQQRGCAWQNDGQCTIIASETPFRGATPEAIIRHELGHCNGWDAGHAGVSRTGPNPRMERYIRGLIAGAQGR